MENYRKITEIYVLKNHGFPRFFKVSWEIGVYLIRPPSSVQAFRREVIARKMGDFLADDTSLWAGRLDPHDQGFDPYTPLAVDSGDVERGELSAAVHSART